MKAPPAEVIAVRRVHRRDLNRSWDFLKLVFRDVNKSTLEYQRPRTKHRFLEVYDAAGTDQLLFVVGDKIVGYAECSYSTAGADNWMNPRYFEKRGMRPLFVDELAVHPHYQGRGVGGFMLEQIQHLGRSHGSTHMVLEVAQNNKAALKWYHKRNFYRLDAAIFLAQKVPVEPELLPARPLPSAHASMASAAKNPGVKAAATKATAAKTNIAKKLAADATAVKKPTVKKPKTPTAKKPAPKAPTAKKPAKKTAPKTPTAKSPPKGR